jgi:hypothetical protein
MSRGKIFYGESCPDSILLRYSFRKLSSKKIQ